MEGNTDFKSLLSEKILSFYKEFDKDVLAAGIEKFELMKLSAGDFLLKQGEVCDKIFITEKSITRSYILQEDGDEKTTWIEPEMGFITDFQSYKNLEPSPFNIHLYEDSDVYCISKESFEALYLEFHDWAIFGTRIFEYYLVYSFQLTSTFLYNDASENYQFIEQAYPRFIQVVPLKHIASRLGISPVTISRIRAERFKK